jgi:hypothetical protein
MPNVSAGSVFGSLDVDVPGFRDFKNAVGFVAGC